MSSYYEKLLATGKVKCIDEEIPFEIPQGWEWCRLVEVGKTETGTTPSKSHPEFFGDYIPFLGPANILNSKIVSVTQGLSDIGVDYGRIVPKNTILQVCIGGSIGKCAITDKPVTFNQQINSITPYLCNVEFVHIVLQSEYFRLAIMDKATGTATPIINRGNWETLLFPLPPINEQERIVANITELTHFLGIYSNKQEELNKLNSNMYQRLKKAILQEAIQGKLVPQIAEEGTAQDLLKQIKEEKLKLVKEGKLKKSALKDSVIFKGDDNKYWEKKGTTCECIDEDIPFDIPKSWAWARLETILNTGSARRVHAKDWRQAGIPFYRAREIGKLADEGFVDNELYIDLSLYEDFSSSGVPLPNDLMITAVGTLGKVYIVKESDKFYYKDGSVLCLANKYGLCAEYLKMVIESPFFKGQYRQESQGTTVATLTMVRLQKYFIPIPPLQEQYRIVETYRNIASIMS
ncbi:restriction endonuclease subunit S [Segatella copri]|uniref:Restriction endonuclease subunit S n=1 Tax=Segatella copri TaxID=165179 RepID=A0A414THJ7_9BACT|nr:restriction endonuclease subunit S [Segatella copri]RHG33652.1 restriction endonuclease subunit S [Segatella copri]RHG64192.1 restriction endonuclease subunit S [Segatella copri]